MSRGSTFRRRAERAAGLPVSPKEKLKFSTFGLIKIALGDIDPKLTALNTLNLIGIKPKQEAKNEPTPETA